MVFARHLRNDTNGSALEIDGRRVPVEVRTNPRARRLIVKVEPTDGRVVVVAPNARSQKAALNFAKSQKDWIAERLAEIAPAVPFQPRTCVPLRGELFEIEHHPDARRGVWAKSTEKHNALCVSGDLVHLPRRVTQFFKKEAKADIGRSVEMYTAKLALPRPRITLRDTTTRWGSCSQRSGLSFSWRLVLAPSFVLDYVAAHEVAHLKHMNHSNAFWRLVNLLYGDPSHASAWLHQNGRNLHRFGRPSVSGGMTTQDCRDSVKKAGERV